MRAAAAKNKTTLNFESAHHEYSFLFYLKNEFNCINHLNYSVACDMRMILGLVIAAFAAGVPAGTGALGSARAPLLDIVVVPSTVPAGPQWPWPHGLQPHRSAVVRDEPNHPAHLLPCCV